MKSRNRFLRHADYYTAAHKKKKQLCYRLAASYTGRGSPPVFLGDPEGSLSSASEDEESEESQPLKTAGLVTDRLMTDGEGQKTEEDTTRSAGRGLWEDLAEGRVRGLGRMRMMGDEEMGDEEMGDGEAEGEAGDASGRTNDGGDVEMADAQADGNQHSYQMKDYVGRDDEVEQVEGDEADQLRLWKAFQNSWESKEHANDSSAFMIAFSELRHFFATNGPLLTYTLEAFDYNVYNPLGLACSADNRFGRRVAMAAVTLSLKILLATQIDALLPTDGSLARHILELNRDRQGFSQPGPFATCLRQALQRCQSIWDAAFQPQGICRTVESGDVKIDAILLELTRLVLRFRTLGQELVFYNPGNVVLSAIARSFPSWEANIGDLDIRLNLSQGSQHLSASKESPLIYC